MLNDWTPFPSLPNYEANSEGVVRRVSDGFIKKYTHSHGARLMSIGGKSYNFAKVMRECHPTAFHRDLLEGELVAHWRDWYHITSLGRCFSTRGWNWLSPIKPNSSYYWRYNLHPIVDIHLMVGRSFLNYEEGLEVMHIDETLPAPEIYQLSNLRLGTHYDNMKDAANKGRVTCMWDT